MLIHSLWQGLLFSVATGLVMLRTKKMSAALRYNLLTGLFLLFLAGCGGTFLYEWRLSGQAGPVGLSKEAAVSGGSVTSFIGTLNAYFSDHASLIVLGWFLIFFSKCIRMTGSLLYTRRIRHYGTSEAPAGWNETIEHFCRQLGITKKVELMQSRLVKMPLVAGHWKPIILIPLGLLTQLPEGEIEAMLLHELAHIRRNDYLVNIVQHIAENIFFFNPGLLWISALLREEREHCCDDMAIARTNNKIQFIQALINFKEHDLRAAGLANAFPARQNQLVHRVMRIAQNKNKTLNPGEKIFLLGSLLVVAFLLFAGGREVSVANSAGGDHQWVLARKDRVIISRNEGGLSLEGLQAYFRNDARNTTGDPVTSDQGTSNKGTSKQVSDNQATSNQGMSDRVTHNQAPDNYAGRTPVMPRPASQPVRPRAAAQRIVSSVSSQVITEKELAWNDRTRADSHPVEDLNSEEALHPVEALNPARALHSMKNLHPIENSKTQSEKDAAQAVLDRIQAERDRAQAVKDREQALKDREQAVLDSRQAERDRQQAIKDREQADRDRAQAVKDREQAEKDRHAADRDRAQAEKDRMQADIDRVEAQKKRADFVVQSEKYKIQKNSSNRPG